MRWLTLATRNADFFLGAASSYAVTLNSPYLHYHDAEYDAYFQDDWHVNEKLTLNLGLRYEDHPPIQEQNNLVFGFDFARGAVVTGEPISQMIAKGFTTPALITNVQNLGVNFESPQEAGVPPHLVNGAQIFNPRVGFAFSPFRSGSGTVFRAGFGQYVYPIPTRNFYSIQKNNTPIAQNYSQSYTTANQSPDGLPNYLLRAPQTIIAGKNSAGVVNTGTTTSVLPGNPAETVFNPHYPPNVVRELSATVEQPLKGNQVIRVSYGNELGSNLDQLNYHNQTIPTYVYEATTGMIPPTGTYATVALNPYDNHTYGTVTQDDRTGYSNNNFAQVNFQRLYKKGLAYQGFYTYSRAFRVGGNTFRDSAIYPVQDYLPGVLAYTDPASLNRQVNYQLDSAIPKHHIGLNFIYDLPFGRGKRFFSKSNRFVDELIGGFQLAGDATITSQYFQVAAANFGQTAPIKLYKNKIITDCSFNPCRQAHLWFNGYISPNLIKPYCAGNPTITGLPVDYVPYQQPIQNNPGIVTCNGTTPTFSNKNYLTNNVPLTLANGSTVTIGYTPGPSASNYNGTNPFSHTYLAGPWIHTADASLFKVFPITEKVYFRLNADFFNVFNIQGIINPNTTSGEQFFTAGQTNSQNTPRQVQLTARLTF